MATTDPTTDYLTRVRNANMAKRNSVEILTSSMKKSLNEILKNKSSIRDCQVEDDNKQGMIKIFLKYGPSDEHVISDLKRISKPGLRDYVGAGNLPKVLNGLGIAIISTSVGVITDKEAKEENVGGGVIAYVW